MKTKLFLAGACLLLAFVVICYFKSNTMPTGSSVQFHFNEEVPGLMSRTNSIVVFEDQNGPIKITVNDNTGEYAVVEPGEQIVRISDKNGKEEFSTNIISSLGNFPIVGEKKITALKVDGQRLLVVVGKHMYVFIYPQKKEVVLFGQD